MKNKDYVYYPLRKIKGEEELMTITKGQGIYVWDDKGKKYIDGQCGLWNVSLGYSNENIVKAITDQLNSICYINTCDYTNPVIQELGQKLISIMPQGFNKLFYTCTGSESVELCIKLVRKYHKVKGNDKKTNIAVFESSYHGTYYGAMSASRLEDNFKRDYGPMLQGFMPVKVPFCRCCKINNLSEKCKFKFLEDVRKAIEENKDTLAAFILEPILGSAGVIPLSVDYMQELRRLCDENDILLICDEVATGFGRTGKLFAFEHYGIKPDMVSFSKGINSGYLPFGAVVIDERITAALEENNSMILHLSTQNGNPIACASALANINTILSGDYVSKVREKGRYLKERLREILGEHPLVFDIRGEGLMLAIDLVEDRLSNANINMDKLVNIIKLFEKRGLLLGMYNNTKYFSAGLVLFLPFIIEDEELNKVIDIFEKVFKRVV